MPRGFKKIKLSGRMKVNRMHDDDPPLYQRQVANSGHGDEAVYDHAIEDYPAEEGVDAAGAEQVTQMICSAPSICNSMMTRGCSQQWDKVRRLRQSECSNSQKTGNAH
jgi:hypothetical protein